jgi:6-phosphogluconolactonase
MIAPPAETLWTLLDDAEAVAKRSAETILEVAALAISDNDEFKLVLAGGRTPRLTYRLLAQADADWNRWKIYYGDERCLPVDDAERNSAAANDVWLGKVQIPEANLFTIPAELGPRAAAEAYSAIVRAAVPFDLVLLGIGEDGHTASLFPGQAEPEGTLVMPVYAAPKPPSERVSLTSAALSSARSVLIQVTGTGKQEALARWRKGEALPVSRVGALRKLEVVMDRAAFTPTRKF